MEGAVITEIMWLVSMLMGMGAGMAASPFMMKKIKQWRIKRKVSRMLAEIAKSKRDEVKTEEQMLEN